MKPHQQKRRQQRKNRQGKAFRRAIIRALSNMPKVKLTDDEINRIRIALDYRKSNAKLLAPFPWEVENIKRDKEDVSHFHDAWSYHLFSSLLCKEFKKHNPAKREVKIPDWPRPEKNYTQSAHYIKNWPKPEDVARAIMEKEPGEWVFPKNLKTSANFNNEEDEKGLQKIKEIINRVTK